MSQATTLLGRRVSWDAVVGSSLTVAGGTAAALTVMSIASIVAEVRGGSSRVGRAALTARLLMPKPVTMGNAGDICQSCIKFWRHQKLPGVMLQYVKDSDGRTVHTDGGTEVVVCPHCDGDAILKLAKGA